MICPHCHKSFPRRQGKIEITKAKEVLDLCSKGYSLREIQELTGVSFSTVGRIIQKAKCEGEKP